MTLSLLIAALLAAAPAYAVDAELPRATGADRAVPAPAAAARPVSMPEAVQANLAHGMKLSLIEMHRLPLAAFRLVLPHAGAAADPQGMEGLAALTAAMLKEGTQGSTAAEFAERAADKGIRIAVSSDDDQTTITVFALKESLGDAMGLVNEMLTTPAYLDAASPRVQQALARLKTQAITGLDAAKGDPESLAGKRLAERVYAGHPYARSADKQSLTGIAAADVRRFHEDRLLPAGAVLAVAGDVDLNGVPGDELEEVKALADAKFGTWYAQAQRLAATRRLPGPAATPVPKIGDVSAVPQSAAPAWTIDLIHTAEGAQQTKIRMGHLSVGRDDPDWTAVQVMHFLLGGPMVGRLEANIREDKSWAYGARAAGETLARGGRLSAETSVKVDVTAAAVLEIVSEIRRLRTTPVGADELDGAKRLMKGLFVLRQRTVQAVAGQAAAIAVANLPADTLQTYRDRVDAVTAADVRRAARKYLRPNDIHIVLAGDAKAVYPQLLPFAPTTTLRVLDRDMNEIPNFGASLGGG